MRTTIVNASQLAFLLNEKVSDCKKMITHVYKRESDFVSVHDFEKAYNHFPVKIKIESIERDYLKRGATREYIMSYPQTKINEAKSIVRQICIPKTLKSFLSKEQINEILECWNTRYNTGNKDYDIIFS